MLVSSQAPLMYPALSGLGSLGCGEDCGCGCSSPKPSFSLGDLDVWGSSWCGSGNPFVDLFCSNQNKALLLEQAVQDTSVYGSNLTQGNRDLATQMASNIVANDNPCNYSALNGMSQLEAMLKCGQVNWPLVGLVALGGFIFLKKV